MERIMSILSELRPDIDFENETGLVTGRILDSFDIISLVGTLSDEYDINVRPADLIPENFDTPQAIKELVDRLMDED